MRRLSTLLIVLALGGACCAPALGQHGQDPQPPRQAGTPSGANPTADAANEQKLLRELGRLEGRVTIPDYKAAILQQPQGRAYQSFHERILPWVSGSVIVLMILALAAFYLVRGRIRLDQAESGIRIERFNVLERLAHWMTAAAFIVLAITGLNFVFGKRLLFPLIGPEAFAAWSQWAKFAHDTMAWPFLIGILVMAGVWLRGNLPDRHDWRWIREFGGFISKRHPPAGRFNAGQKLIFWSVVIFGLTLSVSGIVMLFPFWSLDINSMQWAQYVHASAATVLIAVIIAHIYIGTVGMEGAYQAMGTGEVDLTWAREHHSAWVEEEHLDQRGARRRMQPAE